MKTIIALFGTLLLTIPLLNAQQPHHGALSKNGSMYFRAEPVNNRVLNVNNEEVHYYLHLQGLEKKEDPNHPHIPLNLALVIDRSGSMEGEKLAYTKQAVGYVIKQLSKKDILSIVMYDTEVEVLIEPQFVENKQQLINKVNEIESGNSTNLEGGIREGYKLVNKGKKLLKEEMVNSVFLLSDGLANVGITDAEQLANISRSHFMEDNISIATFGVGLDYNEDLMTKLSEPGGGGYYFIDTPEKLPEIFKQELSGISKIIAKNTMLEISFPTTILKYEKSYGYLGIENDNVVNIQLNDIFSEMQKVIILEFKLKQPIDSSITLSCKLAYNNSMTDSLIAVTDLRSSAITIAANKSEYDGSYNKPASEGYILYRTNALYDVAIRASENQDYRTSRFVLREAIQALDEHFKNIGDNAYLRSIYDDLIEYEKIIDELKDMPKEKVRYRIKRHKANNTASYRSARFY